MVQLGGGTALQYRSREFCSRWHGFRLWP